MPELGSETLTPFLLRRIADAASLPVTEGSVNNAAHRAFHLGFRELGHLSLG
jgi:hypothetical protein